MHRPIGCQYNALLAINMTLFSTRLLLFFYFLVVFGKILVVFSKFSVVLGCFRYLPQAFGPDSETWHVFDCSLYAVKVIDWYWLRFDVVGWS